MRSFALPPDNKKNRIKPPKIPPNRRKISKREKDARENENTPRENLPKYRHNLLLIIGHHFLQINENLLSIYSKFLFSL